ncbi:hypothetical protein, partial [Cellvibrio sp.]
PTGRSFRHTGRGAISLTAMGGGAPRRAVRRGAAAPGHWVPGEAGMIPINKGCQGARRGKADKCTEIILLYWGFSLQLLTVGLTVHWTKTLLLFGQ